MAASTAATSSGRLVQCLQLGKRVPYTTALEWQRAAQTAMIDRRKQQTPTTSSLAGTVFLLEHEPVYTLGRGSKEEFVLDRSINVVRVERGGEVTYHGPGQLVGYLILDLEFFKKDLHWMLRNVEESIIRTVGHYGIKGDRVAGRTGVWVDNAKVAAIGLSAKQWVTMHGFALNVAPTCLSGFGGIVPCGIKHTEGSVSCMSKLVNRPELSLSEVRDVMVHSMESVFDMQLVSQSTLLSSITSQVGPYV